MSANYGGTELQAALGFVLNSRNSQKFSMVFLLTDGKVRRRLAPFYTSLMTTRRSILVMRLSLQLLAQWKNLAQMPHFVSLLLVLGRKCPALLSKALHGQEMAKVSLPLRWKA